MVIGELEAAGNLLRFLNSTIPSGHIVVASGTLMLTLLGSRSRQKSSHVFMVAELLP